MTSAICTTLPFEHARPASGAALRLDRLASFTYSMNSAEKP